MNISAQATDVKKHFISVQEVCKKGNRVTFKEDGPIIRNEKSGIEIEIIQRKGSASLSWKLRQLAQLSKGTQARQLARLSVGQSRTCGEQGSNCKSAG